MIAVVAIALPFLPERPIDNEPFETIFPSPEQADAGTERWEAKESEQDPTTAWNVPAGAHGLSVFEPLG